jgi:hypothetical protein
MRFIKTFEQYDIGLSFYNKEWEDLLPETITIIKADQKRTFKKGNIMTNANMLQIIYGNDDLVGEPAQIEFDIYYTFNENRNSIKLTVEITHGDQVVSDFTIEPPNKVNVVQYTSYHSKFDPSNTVFALDDSSLQGFVNYLNAFNHGLSLSVNDFKFLDSRDNYNPN